MANSGFIADAKAISLAFKSGDKEPLLNFKREFTQHLKQWGTHKQLYPELVAIGHVLGVQMPETTPDNSGDEISTNIITRLTVQEGKYHRLLPIYLAWLALRANEVSANVYKRAGLIPRSWEGDPPSFYDLELSLKTPAGSRTEYTVQGSGLLYRIRDMLPAIISKELNSVSRRIVIAAMGITILISVVSFTSSMFSADRIERAVQQDIEISNTDYLAENVSQVSPKAQQEQLEYVLNSNKIDGEKNKSKVEGLLSFSYLFTDVDLSSAYAQDSFLSNPENTLGLVAAILTGDEATSTSALRQFNALVRSKKANDANLLAAIYPPLGGSLKKYEDSAMSLQERLDVIWADLSLLEDDRLFELVAMYETLLAFDHGNSYLARKFLNHSKECVNLQNKVFLTACEMMLLKKAKDNGLDDTEYFESFQKLIDRALIRSETSFANILKLTFAKEAISHNPDLEGISIDYLNDACNYAEDISDWQRSAYILSGCSGIYSLAKQQYDQTLILNTGRRAIARVPNVQQVSEFFDGEFLSVYLYNELRYGDPKTARKVYHSVSDAEYARTKEGKEKLQKLVPIDYLLVEHEYKIELDRLIQTNHSVDELARLSVRRLQALQVLGFTPDQTQEQILDAMLLTASVNQRETSMRLKKDYVEMTTNYGLSCLRCETANPQSLAVFHLLMLRQIHLQNEAEFQFNGLDIMVKGDNLSLGPSSDARQLSEPLEQIDLLLTRYDQNLDLPSVISKFE